MQGVQGLAGPCKRTKPSTCLPKVCEGFLILDNDIPKDASMEMTVLDMVLDWCSDILSKKGIVFPEHLVLEVWETK